MEQYKKFCKIEFQSAYHQTSMAKEKKFYTTIEAELETSKDSVA